jgi:hypothetical protein
MSCKNINWMKFKLVWTCLDWVRWLDHDEKNHMIILSQHRPRFHGYGQGEK